MRKSAGFTLIELLVTVAIISVLAAVAVPLSEVSLQRAKERELHRSLQELREAIDAYKHASDEGRIARAADRSGYPPSLRVLVEGVPDAKSPKAAKLYFLRRIPRDPFSVDAQFNPELSWGQRSYESAPDDPRPGPDVYDVYSLRPGVGLNGIPYREW
jgi:general secretion pathway protein G